MVTECLERVKNRGIHHPTLVYSHKTKAILERFHSELSEPSDSLKIDMRDSTETQLKKVLTTVGISCDDEKLRMALVVPKSKNPVMPKKLLYWKIDIQGDKHVTLAYKPSAEDTKRLMPFFGQEVEVVVEYILRTSKVHVARVCNTPFLQEYCKNKHPHITLWTADGVETVEANEALELDFGEKEYVTNMSYKGIVTVEVKK
jgi:hypothetical protein